MLFKALTTGPTANPCTTPADLALERAAADAPWFLAYNSTPRITALTFFGPTVVTLLPTICETLLPLYKEPKPSFKRIEFVTEVPALADCTVG